jgi:hypothetical protein
MDWPRLEYHDCFRLFDSLDAKAIPAKAILALLVGTHGHSLNSIYLPTNERRKMATHLVCIFHDWRAYRRKFGSCESANRSLNPRYSMEKPGTSRRSPTRIRPLSQPVSRLRGRFRNEIQKSDGTDLPPFCSEEKPPSPQKDGASGSGTVPHSVSVTLMLSAFFVPSCGRIGTLHASIQSSSAWHVF